MRGNSYRVHKQKEECYDTTPPQYFQQDLISICYNFYKNMILPHVLLLMFTLSLKHNPDVLTASKT